MIQSLQAGRAIASLAVVAHHAAIAASAFAGPFAGYAVLELGYLGVDFFFVLSGFIIFHATAGKAKSASEFAAGRFRRVYLPYLPVGIGMAVLYTLLPQLSAGSHNWSWLATLTLAPVTSATALSVAWTLKHEILFYALFGLGYFTGRLWWMLGLWLALIAAGIFAGWPDSIVLAPINLEFFMGIAGAILARRGWGPGWLLIFSPLVFGIWFVLGADRALSPIAGLAFGLAMLPVIRLEKLGTFTVPTRLTFLGAASYAIYLIHNPVISAAMRLYSANPYGSLLFGTVAGTWAGIAYYWIVERRLLKMKHSHFSATRTYLN